MTEWLEPYADIVAPPGTAGHGRIVERLLRAVREHLCMDVAFVSEITGGHRIFRYVDAGDNDGLIEVGDVGPAKDSYCGHVVSGDLPELLVDPARHPLAGSLQVTSELPVGSHLSVPITFSDGSVLGTLCCISFDVRSGLNQDHVAAVRMVAQLAGEYVEAIHHAESDQRTRRETVETVLTDPHGMDMLFQPLRDLDSMEIVGIEALARFPRGDFGPEWFFAQATEHGLGVELETRAVHLALEALPRIPEPIRLSVNVSPDTLQSDMFLETIAGVPPGRLVVEVTEHAVVHDYTGMKRAAARLSALGVRLAIDDVGMGFSGLNRILESAPQELKLDAVVITGVETNTVKQALVDAFCTFGRRAGFDVIAEGIETHEQRQCLRELGVQIGQGYHLGRPSPLDTVLASTSHRTGHRGLATLRARGAT